MSCLYSSPEVTSVELLVLKSIAVKLQALDCRHRRLARSGAPHARPDRGAVRFHTDFAVRRRQQRRVPQQPSGRRWLYQVIPPAKTSTGSLRGFSSAISGFRSLCGRKQRSSLKPSRSIRPAFWNLSLGAGSRFENPGLHP